MRTMYFYPFQLIFFKQPQNSATGWLDCGRQSERNGNWLRHSRWGVEQNETHRQTKV
ncbi:hypothetical protein B0H12DRAFT_1106688, partial [Mycena haematopus]